MLAIFRELLRFLACATYVSIYVVGITYVVKITKINCYDS
jgi:hypothetical protein